MIEQREVLYQLTIGNKWKRSLQLEGNEKDGMTLFSICGNTQSSTINEGQIWMDIMPCLELAPNLGWEITPYLNNMIASPIKRSHLHTYPDYKASILYWSAHSEQAEDRQVNASHN